VRVLMLAPSYEPATGGVERVVAGLGRALTARGVEVTIVTPQVRGAPLDEATAAGRVLRVPPPAGRDRAGNGDVRRWLARRRDDLGPLDAVHAHDYVTAVSWLLPNRWRFRGVPWFVTFHGYEGYPVALRDKLLRRLANRLAQGSIAVGGFIPGWYGTRCDVVNYGAADTVADPAPAPAADPGEVAFLGRLAPDTGLDTVLRGLALLPSAERPRLTVLGEGELRPAMESLAAELGIEARFAGWQAEPWAQVPSGAAVVVTGYLSVLETWSRGHPAMAVYADPLREDYYRSLPHAADALVLAADPAGFADGVRRLRSDPGAREAVVAAAMPWARRQTWDALADTYLDLWSGQTCS